MLKWITSSFIEVRYVDEFEFYRPKVLRGSGKLFPKIFIFLTISD